jgi:4-amino-4-deoxy-L-arabinose transferase-like glycosyltransferase
LGSFMLATEARRAMLDLPVALCTVLSVLVVVQAHQRVEPRRLYLAALLAALGTLFKGPVILIFLGAAAIAAVSLPELRRRMLPRRCWYGPLAIFCLLASIWPLLVYLYVPEAGSLLRADLAERQMAWPSLGSVLRVVGGLLVVALPWSLALLVGALRGARQGRWPTAAVERFLLLWILFATLPFLVIRPFERYFLPILPALLLWVVLLLRRIEPGKPAPALLVAVGLLAVPTLAFAGLAAWFERQWLVPAASVLALSTAVLLAWRGQLVPTVQATAVTLALSLGWVYPGLGINRIPDEVLAALRGAEARHYGSPYPGLLSMHLGHSVPIIPNEAGPEALPIRGGPVLLRTEDLGPLRTRAAAAGLEVRIAQRFRSFYARTQFLRFTRPGVRGADWRQALRARDWEPLKSEFVLAELLPAAEHSLSRRTVPP